jgi:hypothetical protein
MSMYDALYERGRAVGQSNIMDDTMTFRCREETWTFKTEKVYPYIESMTAPASNTLEREAASGRNKEIKVHGLQRKRRKKQKPDRRRKDHRGRTRGPEVVHRRRGSSERAKMADDLRFAALDQWPAEIRKDREGDVENGPRPCLTIDKLNQYIVQVVNDVRQGRPGINVARRTITPMSRRRES